MQKSTNKWIIWFLFWSFIGFVVSAYLAAKYYMGEVPTCSFLKGCEFVTTSKYSKIGPFPISLFGAGYFLSLLILLVAYLDSKKFTALKIFMLLTLPGALVSSYLIWLQAAVIKAVCIYCITVDSASLLLFVSSMFLRSKLKKESISE